MPLDLRPSSPARRTLDALARIVVPQAFEDTPAADDVMRTLAARLASLPPHIATGIASALRVLQNPILRWGISHRLAAWDALPAEARLAAFERWGRSSFGPARTVYQAVRRLLLSTYYGSAGGHHDVGILPPLHRRKPVLAWEGPLDSPIPPNDAGVVERAGRQQLVPRANPMRTLPHQAVTLGSGLRGTFRLSADVVVIGSGAGGSLMASRLAAAGLEVLILESGPWLQGADFTEDEATLIPRLFAEAGMRATDDLAVSILQGGAAGGGTTVNWMMMHRPGEHVLHEWRTRFGLDHLTSDRVAAACATIEHDLRAGMVPSEAHSPSNRALLDGAARLGWHAAPVALNTHGCVRAGSCSLGCRYGAKQSALEVYLPRAFAGGARLLTGTRAVSLERLERDTGQGTPPRTCVHAVTIDEVTQLPVGDVTIETPRIVIAAGAIETPALLQRSGMGGGVVGRYLRLHPTTLVLGDYPDDRYPLAGIPLSAVCDEFNMKGPNGYGFWIECPAMGAALAAVAMPGVGAPHRDLMRGLYRTTPFIALTRDGADLDLSNGSVLSDRRGRIQVKYRLGPTDTETMRKSVEATMRLHLAAGATTARTLHVTPVTASSERDLAAVLEPPSPPACSPSSAATGKNTPVPPPSKKTAEWLPSPN
ncbi:MAG: GMC family oxidoreductase N-terminal domain-containing protein, partial [Cytophagaceae bacterium]|nr:GMC family oxidoreductase N-terminal domain-containing protein [Gemmatimonadaceae bacterium]